MGLFQNHLPWLKDLDKSFLRSCDTKLCFIFCTDSLLTLSECFICNGGWQPSNSFFHRSDTTVSNLSSTKLSLHIGQKKERNEKKSEVLRCFSLMPLCWLLLKTRCEYVCESKASLMKSCTHTWTYPIAISSWGEKIQVLTVIGKFHLNLLADVHRISQATDMEKAH